MFHRRVRACPLILAPCLALAAPQAALSQHRPPTPAPVEGMAYDAPFFPGADHDPAVPSPRELLGFREGDRAATPAEIERCLRAWEASDRALLVEYARSHENRPLFYMVISSPQNIARIEEIVAARAKLADQRGVADAELQRIARDNPAVAWLGYSIHGDETSGADAAVSVIHHLVADRTDETAALLRDLVVVVDPMMNPDGRHRYLQMITEMDGVAPDLNEHSLIHRGYWPAGRHNHYLFDLNRDWIFGVHPETRGRIRAVRRFNPLLFVDAHEMGAQDTYLFSPAREPNNIHIPRAALRWGQVFAADQAAAFDRFGWRFYTGEWNEGWYPGYSDAWASFRGAVPILYEQAGVLPYGVRRPEGTVLSYRQGVHQQAVSSIANLRSLQANRAEMTRDFIDHRAAAIAPDAPWASRVYAVPPSANTARTRAFVDLLLLQGVEVRIATAEFSAAGVDRVGVPFEGRAFPVGTLLVSGRQPDAHLLATLMDFDPRMPDSFLQRERRELLRFGQSRLYDITAWNIPMLHDVDAHALSVDPAREIASRPYAPDALDTGVDRRDPAVGWVIDGGDDASVLAAAQLMERAVQVRVSDRAFEWDGRAFARGSVVVTRVDNLPRAGELADTVDRVCRDVGVRAHATDTGLGPGDDNPDSGGEHFPLMHRPRVAVVTRDGVSATSFGELWHTLDHRLAIPTTLLEINALGAVDLRRYNVIVVPSSWGRQIASAGSALQGWVEGGGTLIAVGSSSAAFTQPDSGVSEARSMTDALENLDVYEQQVLREWQGRTAGVDPDALWSHTAAGVETYPWKDAPGRPALDELKRRDMWDALFSPQGAIVAARADDKHWLTFGVGDYLPALVSGSRVLMAPPGVEAPIRLGHFLPAPEPEPEAEAEADDDEGDDKGENGDKPEAKRVGWSLLPQGVELRMRMSGLLWPEAAQRMANSAYVTRESRGSGQVILFLESPAFRGATLGAQRVFHNAVVYGPGFGADHPVLP